MREAGEPSTLGVQGCPPNRGVVPAPPEVDMLARQTLVRNASRTLSEGRAGNGGQPDRETARPGAV
jgi:hypothetical protein